LLFAQLGRRAGATVIGTTSTPSKAKLAKKNGADYVILYPVEDTVKKVLELTNGEGVDAVFDGVGKDTCVKSHFIFMSLQLIIPRSFDNNFKLIKRKGTIVSVGNASGAVPPFSLPKLVEKNIKLLRPTSVFPRNTAEGVLTKIHNFQDGKLCIHARGSCTLWPGAFWAY
jgi:NADPH:quinone reductase